MLENDYDPILSVEQVMDLLCVGKNAVYRLLKSGELGGFKIGRVWKISRDAMEHFIISKNKRPR